MAIIIKNADVKLSGYNAWDAELCADGSSVRLDVDLYVNQGIDGYWLSPEEAKEELEKLISEYPEATFEGKATFEGFGNWDSDNPEDCFGVIYVKTGFRGRKEVVLSYGRRIYDIRNEDAYKAALAAYIGDDSQAADPEYVVEACAAAGITPEMLREMGLDDIADAMEEVEER
jgi:hypothetical protein